MQDLMARCSNKQTQIENYEIVHTIGEGWHATVLLAWHVVAGTEVALKVIKKRKLKFHYVLGFMCERRHTQLLNHENIVKVLNVIDTEDSTITVLEYMSRGDMQAYLDDQGRMMEQEAQQLFRQLLLALNHCHEWGIVHWDLKPSNLFLDVDQNVKTADFTLSYDYCPGEKLGTFCGTPVFTAPEIFLELMYLGLPVDVWSLGVILYIMVTGFEPFQGRDYQEAKQSVLTGHYYVPDDLVPLFNEPLNTGVPGTGSSPQRPVSGDALSSNACTIPLALVCLYVTCQLQNPSPQDTEHSAHVPVSHLCGLGEFFQLYNRE